MNDMINQFRFGARKLVRELGILDLEHSHLGRSPKLWHALIEIANRPNITLVALSQLLVLTPPTMTRIINTLLKEGLVKTHSGLDKREKTLTITVKGKEEIEKVDAFSNKKILGAFDFLSENDRTDIAHALMKYANALEQSRLREENVAIHTLSTSRVLRKQLIAFIASIQKDEFNIPITDEINAGILRAEDEYYFNRSCNFWYAVDDNGAIIGCIGLKKINQHDAEIKKFFVAQAYRGKGVSKKLFHVLLTAAMKHEFNHLYLGTVDILHAAKRFYEKYGFTCIAASRLPPEFIKCELDTLFFKGQIKELRAALAAKIE
jgi:DNA-binding MarR family transcriptional regulator/N-acetylglutamate synthase-like GNAT family acetyltransferase